MKTLIYIFLVVFFSQLSFAQKDGTYKKYHDNGQLKTLGQYKNKKRIGKWKSFYETGELSSIYSYTNGELNKISKSFYKDSSLKSETKKIDDHFINSGYYKSGKLLYERVLKNGYYKEYLENGALKIESNYLDNQLSGIWKRFFSTGELEWEVSYKDGYKDGYYKQFYKNGQLRLEGIEKKNKKNGEEIIYDEKGNSVGLKKFKKGALVSNKSVNKLAEVIVPDGHFEQVPIFPGCENELSNRTQKKCMSSGISKIIFTNFNTDLAADLNLIGRLKIYLTFKINKEGNITNINAKAPHLALKMEAIRIAKLLPKIKPGKVRGKTVEVPYSLPIIFQVQK